MLTLFVVLPSHVIAALPSPPIPGGVFALIKAGAPTGSSVLSNPDVDGISLRIGWSSVNPSEDKYDWSYFDAEITKAKNAGKKVLIRVSDGGKSLPDWVVAASKAAGEPSFSFYEKPVQGGAVITEPVFWAPTLLAKKAKLIAAFGARYNTSPTVAIVTCQFAGGRNDDWNVPSGTTSDGIAPSGSSETSRWVAAGWTTSKMVNAGNQVVENTMRAFPDKPVGLAIGRTSTKLTPEGRDYIAQTVMITARAKWGNRMVATHNNISEKAPSPPPPPNSLWSLIYNLRPSVGGQMLWFSYNDSTCRNAANGAPCDAATVLRHSVERAHDYGWHYLEIYNADIVGLPSVIHYAHGLLTQSSPTPTPTPAPIATPTPTPYPPTHLTWRREIPSAETGRARKRISYMCADFSIPTSVNVQHSLKIAMGPGQSAAVDIRKILVSPSFCRKPCDWEGMFIPRVDPTRPVNFRSPPPRIARGDYLRVQEGNCLLGTLR